MLHSDELCMVEWIDPYGFLAERLGRIFILPSFLFAPFECIIYFEMKEIETPVIMTNFQHLT